MVRPFGEGTLSVHGWDYFMSLVSHNFMREEAVVEMVNRVVSKVEEDKVKPGCRINMEIYHYM